MRGEPNKATDQPTADNLIELIPTAPNKDRSEIERQLYDIVAEITLSGSDLLLSPTLKEASDNTVRLKSMTGTTPSYLFISVTGETFERFERALQSDHTVAEPVLVETYDGHRVYRLEPISDVKLITSPYPGFDGRIIDVESGDGGWTVRMQIATREALISFRDYCLKHDVTFQVNQLGDAATYENTDVVGLPEERKRLLRMAYEEGYYEIPRRISQNELAHNLDISTSAISQRLRRDTKQLIGSTLAVEKNQQ